MAGSYSVSASLKRNRRWHGCQERDGQVGARSSLRGDKECRVAGDESGNGLAEVLRQLGEHVDVVRAALGHLLFVLGRNPLELANGIAQIFHASSFKLLRVGTWSAIEFCGVSQGLPSRRERGKASPPCARDAAPVGMTAKAHSIDRADVIRELQLHGARSRNNSASPVVRYWLRAAELWHYRPWCQPLSVLGRLALVREEAAQCRTSRFRDAGHEPMPGQETSRRGSWTSPGQRAL